MKTRLLFFVFSKLQNKLTQNRYLCFNIVIMEHEKLRQAVAELLWASVC